MTPKPKSYASSYLYNRIPDYEKNILEFVMKADRIDKRSEAFVPIVEDVKRRQTSAVLSRVLIRDDVVLCIHTKPLPSSFKVFACNDVRVDQQTKVFIDCTGLLTNKTGFYNCSKIDVFCTYLLNAMTNILYANNYPRIATNSSVIQSGTNCFVSLATHIFDYLRPNGFSENRNKIAYILAMYFQVNILGLDRENNSVKALAGKIATIPSNLMNAMEIYYKDEDLMNIDTIITSITNTFKLKGMNTAAFIEKWMWLYGQGTQFATELFPPFSALITDAFCGSYVNNQKTIEKCCGREIVAYTNSVLKLGSDNIEGGYRYESTLERDHNNIAISESVDRAARTMKFEAVNFNKGDYRQPIVIKQKIDLLAENALDKKALSEKMVGAYNVALEGARATIGCEEGYSYYISNVMEMAKPYLQAKEKEYLINRINESIVDLSKYIKENEEEKDMTDYKACREDYKIAKSILSEEDILAKETDPVRKAERQRVEQYPGALSGKSETENEKESNPPTN